MDFRGFDSSSILILRVGILMSVGNFQDYLSQAILVGIMLVPMEIGRSRERGASMRREHLHGEGTAISPTMI